MKFLICGRTATGKDSLQNLLVREYGWKAVKSQTTRPKRTDDEDSHIFVTEREAAETPEYEKAATTVINGYEYYATIDQVRKADCYIIDPRGIKELLERMPSEKFCLVRLYVRNDDARIQKAVERTDDPKAELAVFKKRSDDEDAEFSAFESYLAETGGQCFEYVFNIENTYQHDMLEKVARTMNEIKEKEEKNGKKRN